MGFDNVQFPDDIGYGSRAGPGFKTQVIEMRSGSEERISRWEQPRHRYDVSKGVEEYDQLLAIKKFFMARKGALQSFLFKDWQDYATNSTHVLYRSTDPAVDGADQPLQRTGDGTLGFGNASELEFDMVLEYEDDVVNFTRPITKPIDGTVIIEVDGTPLTEGADYVITYSTGHVVFTAAPGNGLTVRYGAQFNVEARFDETVDDWLGISFDDFSNGTISSIPLIEITSTVPVTERFWHGGVKDHGNQTSTTVQINQADGRLQRIDPQDANVVAELQRADDLQPGDHHWHIENASGTFTISVETTDATVIHVLAVNDIVEILISDDGAGAKTFIAFT